MVLDGLLPSESIRWESLGDKTTRVTIKYSAFAESFDITLDDNGRPVRVKFQRWSDANSEKTYRRQSVICLENQ